MQIKRQGRMVVAFLTISFCLLALLLRLAYIQLEQADKLSLMAMARDTAMLSLEDYLRGDILDRNGHSLTGSYLANRVAIFPFAVADKDRAAEELARILNVRPSVLDRYFKGELKYLPFDITPAQAETIRQKFSFGITVLPVKHRYGPDPLAPHITGHLGKIPSPQTLQVLNSQGQKTYNYGDWIGVMGLEKYYEYQLKGHVPVREAHALVDARGRLIGENILRVNNNRLDPGRHDVVTTIDIEVQQVVEKVLDRRVQKGAVVVMRPNSGDILACASRPDFNPAPAKISVDDQKKGAYINRATSFFQPGSLFKITLACAALEEGLKGTDTVFFCDGAKDTPIRCWYSPGHGEISLHDAVVNSCNPAFVQLGEKLGAGIIIEYARKLGLGNNSIIGLPDATGRRQNLKAIAAPFNLANSSIGQGPVLVTPVQLTAMMNVIVSGGYYYQPRIVRELSTANNEAIRFPSPAGERVISQSTAGALREMLEDVTRVGVGRNAFIEPCGSAGKTGSAQVRTENGETINAWFSGYFPLDEPRYVITVLVQDGESGGDTAAPVFKEIARELMKLSH